MTDRFRPGGVGERWDHDRGRLARDAAGVLARNDLGGRTKAAPSLYPHQWSWDSAFIAIGLAHLDVARAVAELTSLFEAQWANGKVPHIVYNPDAPAGSYFPGRDHWQCATEDPGSSGEQQPTSVLIQPPVHAVAALRICEVAEQAGQADAAEAGLRALYPSLLAWHRYLATDRDPEGSGLVTIYHPWESGLDNSPRWDSPLAAVEPGELPDYRRADLDHVADADQRPTKDDYDRYVWLVQSVLAGCHDETILHRRHPFLVKDVLASGLFVAANEALAEIAARVGAPRAERDEIAGWADRGRRGLATCWDPELGLGVDYDVRTDRWLPALTVAGFAPLVAGTAGPEQREALLATLASQAFLANPRLWRPLPPSTSPLDPGFRPRSYWRGPMWPVMTWLLWWSLARAGEMAEADRLRATALAQFATRGDFPEYIDPFTGESLGSTDQSWTAAVVLDWLATDTPTRDRGARRMTPKDPSKGVRR